MIKVEVKKIWYGGSDTYGKAKVSLRDYIVKTAVQYNEGIEVEYNGMRMELTPRKLKKPLNRTTFKSKIGKQDYELWDYYWKPKQ